MRLESSVASNFMKEERIHFKAYTGHELKYHASVVKGTINERVEREVFQQRLNRGDFTHVDVTEPGEISSRMVKVQPL
jgi:hypothetical protein